MTVNTERMLVELAQSNYIPLNIGGIQFNCMTLNEYHLEEIEELETVNEIIEYASLIGLGMKGQRAANKKGMDQEKLQFFWKSDEFAVDKDEESLQSLFGKKVLAESDMEHLLVEESEEIDTDSMLGEIETVTVGPNGQPLAS